MKICILGAGGVFGNNLADCCLTQGHEVMGIGRSPRKPECFSLGVKYPYYAYHTTYELEYVHREIYKFVPDAVVNFAAQGEGAASWEEDNWRFYETNCMGLVKLVSTLGIRFIQIGSSEVYGSVKEPVSEHSPLNPTSPYSVSKAAFDLHLIAMHKVKKLPMNIIRPSNCYAPGQQLHRIIPKTLIYGYKGERLPLHGGGASKKSYLHATDLSKAILLIINKGVDGEIYNVGPDKPISILDLVGQCALTLGLKLEELIEIAPERTGQDATYWLNCNKIKALGWKREIGLGEGLTDMLNWLKKYPELLELPTEFVMRA